MILLDTNVLSALMHRSPDAEVVGWLDRQPAGSIWITSITLFEAQFGIALLEKGRRQRSLGVALRQLVDEDLDGRVAEFDAGAATEAARLGAARQARGRSVDLRDTLIAGIAMARRATLATRNTRHFVDLDVPVVNPWDAAA